MNNRIKQLMNDCVLEVEDLDHNDQTVYWTTFDKEKFAELLIRECAAIADKNSPLSYPDHGLKIKRHFGIT